MHKKKPSEVRELIWTRDKNLVNKKIYPKRELSGLFYLSVLEIVTEDHTWIYRGKVTKIKRLLNRVALFQDMLNRTQPKHLAKSKKLPEVRELIWARAKILVKKMKLLVFIEHCVVSLFSYGFLSPLASWFLLDKTFID